MKEKQKSLIEKIIINDATFHEEVIEPTYINFFFGKNGAGWFRLTSFGDRENTIEAMERLKGLMKK